LVEYLVVGAAALVVVVVAWLGFSDTRDAPTVALTTTSIVTESTSVVESDSLVVAWELAERAGIECEPDDGRDLTLEVCEYRGDWVSIRVFPGGEQDAVLEWAESMVERFGSDVLVGDGWGIEYLFSPASDGRLEDIQAGLGEGEIVASRRPVADEVPDVVMGGPLLDWQWVMDLDEDQDFTSVLAAESGLWAVAGDDQVPSVLWYSPDGLAWRELDTATLLGDGAVISDLVEGGPGLVAVGFRPSGGTREAVAWTSTDGSDWTVSPLGYTIPEPEEPFEVSGLDLWHVAVGSSGAVIAGFVWESFVHDELERIIQSALPEGLGEYDLFYDLWNVSVWVGPFPVFSERVENLDIDQDHFSDLYEASVAEQGRNIMFVTDDYLTWRQLDEWPFGEWWLDAMTATADGFLAATSDWGPGPFYKSVDGITWEETPFTPDLALTGWFGSHDGRLLSIGDDAVWESTDGGNTWTVWAVLPPDTWEVRVGGLGLVGWGWYGSEYPPEWAAEEEATVVDSGGYTMTIGEESVSISDADGSLVLTAELSDVRPFGNQILPDFIVADRQRQMFTVVHPDTREALMTVTYREMQNAFETADYRTWTDPATFVAYSPDGRVWSHQTIGELTGMIAEPSLVAVGDNFAAMIIDGSNGASLWRGTAP
jgi:hypothetical protein